MMKRFPINLQDWPAGTYALPKPIRGCPINGEWHDGWRYQDTDNHANTNSWSNTLTLSGKLYTRRTPSFVFTYKG